MPPKRSSQYFSNSRHGLTAVADMQAPTFRTNATKSAQALQQEGGFSIAEQWTPTLATLATQGYSSASTSQQQQQQISQMNTSTANIKIFSPIPRPKPGDWLQDRSESGQTFSSFLRGQFRARPHASYDTIAIVILGKGVPHLEQLREYVSTFYQCKVQFVGPIDIDDEKVCAKWNLKYRFNNDTQMKQFYTSPLMDLCSKIVSNDRELCRRAVCSLGFTMFDLTPNDEYNFVYGIASLADGRGVFSMARFHPDFNGEKYSSTEEANRIILKRCCKVQTHELGHIFGLRHCLNFVCLMNGANHAGELERQPLVECPCCTKKLCCAWGWDLKKRYGELVMVCEKFGFKEEAQRWKECLDLCSS